jgi:FkbM family methyltransferase
MHPLPDFTRGRSPYGLNLIELVRLLAEQDVDSGPIHVVDVGANVGDSAAQILAALDARVLCIEGDPYWASFLRRNLGNDRRVVIEEAFLVVTEEASVTVDSFRSPGTTRFTESEAGIEVAAVSVDALRHRHPEFDSVRVVKSDTDGLDPVLVPALARAWSECSPVLFFEFHPALARASGNSDPGALWDELADLGYSHLAVWESGGDPLGTLDVHDAREAAKSLEPVPSHLHYDYWDVAACRAQDAVANEVLDGLMGGRFSPRGPLTDG